MTKPLFLFGLLYVAVTSAALYGQPSQRDGPRYDGLRLVRPLDYREWPFLGSGLGLTYMCVFMYVGELDEYMWHGEMKQEAEYLRAKGSVARYSVEKGQPHRLDTLAGTNASRLFDGFEEAKKGCKTESTARR